jgi:hypothetical protein
VGLAQVSSFAYPAYNDPGLMYYPSGYWTLSYQCRNTRWNPSVDWPRLNFMEASKANQLSFLLNFTIDVPQAAIQISTEFCHNN